MTEPEFDAYDEVLRLLNLLEKLVKRFESERVVRVVGPSQWMSTEKPDLSFHKCSDKCIKDSEGELCEVTEDELRLAYFKAASMLSSVRFMMGVPGALHMMHDDGIESYDDAKRRAKQRDEDLRQPRPKMNRERPQRA